MASRVVHFYEVHGKSKKTNGKWRVYEVHDNEDSAMKAANTYKLGAESRKIPGFAVKVVKMKRSETPVSERVIPNATASRKPKTNLEKMTDPNAKINAKKPTDKKPKKKVEGKLEVPGKPTAPKGPVLAPKRGK